MLLRSAAAPVLLLGTLGLSGTRPATLGVRDYGGGVASVALCPPSPNCVSSAEAKADTEHFLPAWRHGAASREEAVAQLVEAVEASAPDGFAPTVLRVEADSYVYAEYESPTFGFVDDVEFFFPPGDDNRVEYRSASRLGQSDFGINRKRIQALRLSLEEKGWRSAGF